MSIYEIIKIPFFYTITEWIW